MELGFSVLYSINSIEHIPIHPLVKGRILDIIWGNNNDKEKELLLLVEYDPVLNLELLKIANSKNYGFYGRIASIRDALKIIEIELIYPMLENFPPLPYFAKDYIKMLEWYTKIYYHSIHLKTFLQLLIEAGGLDLSVFSAKRDEIITSALLHDIGLFLLLSFFFDDYFRVLETVEKNRIDISYVEEMDTMYSHSVLGGYIAGVWKLPESIVCSISYHHKKYPSGRYKNLVRLVNFIDDLSLKTTFWGVQTPKGVKDIPSFIKLGKEELVNIYVNSIKITREIADFLGLEYLE